MAVITGTITEEKIIKLLDHQTVKSWNLRFARSSSGENEFFYLIFQVEDELLALVDNDFLYIKYQNADTALRAVAEFGIKITNFGSEI